jgi:HAD superfamily hydrolase (TIGR01490 family)
MKRLIVFDLDHTLIRINSSYAFGSYLFQQKQFYLAQIVWSLIDYMRHQWLGLSMQQLHQKSFNRLFKNFPFIRLQACVQDFLDKNLKDLLSLPVWERLKVAQTEGHETLLLSSSPDFLVQPLAANLGVSGWGATIYQMNEEGNLSHLSQVMDGKQKAHYLLNHLKTSEFSLSSVTAYSDSYLDLPLLEIVGQAIGVNPDKRLKKVCVQNQWEILLTGERL